MIRSILPVALSATLATAAAAETVFTAITPSPDRPYPYEILGLQPGDPLTDVMEQRPMAVYRSIRQSSDQLPEPLKLKA